MHINKNNDVLSPILSKPEGRDKPSETTPFIDSVYILFVRTRQDTATNTRNYIFMSIIPRTMFKIAVLQILCEW